MGKNYLVTSSLISSVEWYQNCPPSWKDKAEEDLYNQINRIWKGGTPEMQGGIDFEKAVYEAAKTNKTGGSEAFSQLVSLIRGGSFQVVAKRIIDLPEIADVPLCLYAKSDVIFPALIRDIKTTGKYKGGKYLGSAQHLLYCFVFGIKEFIYDIAEWDNGPGGKIRELHHEKYLAGDSLEGDLMDRVVSTLGFLKSRTDLWESYITKFSK